MRESPKQETTFGYLTAFQSPDHGYFGGYLVVSLLGRPLEFHCTAPVLPSRAQRILYGPTMEPYLLGEQIAGGLLSAAKLAPCLILTDQPHFEAAQQRTETPLVFLAAQDDDRNVAPQKQGECRPGAASSHAPPDPSREHPSWGTCFTAVGHVLQLPWGRENDREAVAALLGVLTQRVELTEPFERIHEAIREAQRIGTRGPEAHGQAA